MTGKRIIIITGASGSGKTTIGNKLATYGIPRLVTSTTRSMRPNEVDGVDYFFLDKEDLSNHAFIEQTIYNGHTYGLTVNSLVMGLMLNDCVAIVMDKVGARTVKAMYPNETFVIHLSVTEDQMVERMMERGDSLQSIEERVRHAEDTGEFDNFLEADLTLENLTPEENIKWVLACTTKEGSVCQNQ